MYIFLSENPIFVVLIVVLIIWLGIAVFLYIVESKLCKLEKDFQILKGKSNES